MRVVVTGSEGFIGCHTVQVLNILNHDVHGIDLKCGADAADPDIADLVVGWGPDLIIHHAATCSTTGSLERPMETFHNTVATTAMMADAARRSDARFLLTSSVKARDGMTPYGAAKRMAETWVEEFGRSYGLPFIINRPGTVYGPGQEGSSESGWIAWFLRAKHLGFPVTINGDGTQVRDLLHVDDFIQLLVSQIDDFDHYEGETYDVGGGEENAVSVNEMAAYLGLDVTYGPPRSGDADRYVGENTIPGWAPCIRWRDQLR